MIIAVDFDGTIVEHRYPKIGKIRPYAFEALKILQSKGHKLILWSYRTGDELNEAVEFCKSHDLRFWAVNESYPGESERGINRRKLNVEIFIDDRNIGGLPDWVEILRILHPEDYDMDSLYEMNLEKKGIRRFLSKIFK